MFETLAERTLALAQLERGAGRIGYDAHLLARLSPILKDCLDYRIAIIGNFGAADPEGAAEAIAQLALRIGCRAPRIAIVTGDDLSPAAADDELASLLAAAVPRVKRLSARTPIWGPVRSPRRSPKAPTSSSLAVSPTPLSPSAPSRRISAGIWGMMTASPPRPWLAIFSNAERR